MEPGVGTPRSSWIPSNLGYRILQFSAPHRELLPLSSCSPRLQRDTRMSTHAGEPYKFHSSASHLFLGQERMNGVRYEPDSPVLHGQGSAGGQPGELHARSHREAASHSSLLRTGRKQPAPRAPQIAECCGHTIALRAKPEQKCGCGRNRGGDRCAPGPIWLCSLRALLSSRALQVPTGEPEPPRLQRPSAWGRWRYAARCLRWTFPSPSWRNHFLDLHNPSASAMLHAEEFQPNFTTRRSPSVCLLPASTPSAVRSDLPQRCPLSSLGSCEEIPAPRSPSSSRVSSPSRHSAEKGSRVRLAKPRSHLRVPELSIPPT